jgi:hypothetical protein
MLREFNVKCPDTLIHLSISENKLKTINTPLPDSLQTLEVSNNRLETLPHLPNTLVTLSCPYNKLSQLPPLPDTIVYLNCACNKLVELPPIPMNMINLFCQNNRLIELPEQMPSTMNILNCQYNPFPDRMHQTIMTPDVDLYLNIWKQWWNVEHALRVNRAHEKTKAYKEELIQKTWHPDRFTRWCLDFTECSEWNA